MVLEIGRVGISSNLGLGHRGVVVKSHSSHLFAIGYPQETTLERDLLATIGSREKAGIANIVRMEYVHRHECE